MPAMSATDDVTRLLAKWANGDQQALDELTPLVYRELRRLAASQLRKERRSHTLQPTALVNELYLRLVEQRTASWENRAQFSRWQLRSCVASLSTTHVPSRRPNAEGPRHAFR